MPLLLHAHLHTLTATIQLLFKRYPYLVLSVGVATLIKVLMMLTHKQRVTQRQVQATQQKRQQQQQQLKAVYAFLKTLRTRSAQNEDGGDGGDRSEIQLLDIEERKILACTANQLRDRIIAGEEGYDVLSVLGAYLKSLARCQEECNAVTEFVVGRAIETANIRENDRKSISKNLSTVDDEDPQSLLFGLPVTVKDSVNIKSVDSSLGLTLYCNQPSQKDSLVVELLERQGAIVMAKSNIPQTLVSFECVNPVFGTTTHPLNRNRSPGGSTGGEGTMLAMQATTLGIGTDIGGSARIPAHFCGVCGLKPTSKRLTLSGLRPSVPGQEAVPAVLGPLARTVDDLNTVMRALITPHAFKNDPELVPLKWNNAIVNQSKRLVFGYYVDDGVLQASPPVERAIRHCVKELTAAGHTCIEFKPHDVIRAMELYFALMSSDGAKTLTNQLTNEKWQDYVKVLVGLTRTNAVTKKVQVALLKFMGEHQLARIVNATGEKRVVDLWKLQYGRKQYKLDFFNAWKTAGIDVCICPTHVLPAIPHHTFKDISFSASSTFIYNILDMPAGVVPVTTVKADDVYTTPVKGILDKRVRAVYDVNTSIGLPIGVQVVGLPYEDELVVNAMKEVENCVKFSAPIGFPFENAP